MADASRLTDALLYDLIEIGDEAGVYVQAFDVRNGGDRYDEQRAAHVTVAELAGEVIAARAERDRLRHALQVAHDWMGRAPDNDCDEGGGFGAAHLATAERTVIAALNGDCEGRVKR